MESFFLTKTSAIAKIDCIELYHPDFGYLRYQAYDDEGITIKYEDELEYSYDFESFEITRGNITSDLDQGFSITFADYKDDLKSKVNAANHMTPIIFSWRLYRSDDLDSPMFVQRDLYVIRVNSDGTGMVTFEASAEQLNNVKTGDAYTINTYPMLRSTI
jgi:hypothetical protein